MHQGSTEGLACPLRFAVWEVCDDRSDPSRPDHPARDSESNRKGHGAMPRRKLAERLTFKAVFEPDGSGWHAHIPSVRGCRTWGRNLTQARRNIREALATCADVFDDPDRVSRDAEIVEDIRISDDARRELRRYAQARARARTAEEDEKAAARSAARALTRKAGVSLRDAGELLGLSYERVRQVAS